METVRNSADRVASALILAAGCGWQITMADNAGAGPRRQEPATSRERFAECELPDGMLPRS